MSAEQAKVTLARVSKGKKPTYLDERAVDSLYAIAVTIMQENAVMRDRLDTVERLLEQHGVFKQSAVDSYEPEGEAAEARKARNTAYVEKVLRCLQDERQQFDDTDRPE
tara:strand:- start:29568 stop:29894 length:327 start_codon:yes stop_codon:yes gene_type:complete